MRNLITLLILLAIHTSLLAQSMGINLPASTSPNTMLDVNGGVSFREGTALALANGVNNDIALANYSFFRITGLTAAFSITGFANGSDGRALTLINASTQNMTLTHQATSSAANQINTGGSSVVLPSNGVVTMMYNATLSKWIVSGIIGNLPSLSNITNGALSDSLMVVNNGVPFRVSPADFIETYAWGLEGNANTVDGTHFLGTTDNIPLSIRVNNNKAGRIDHLTSNTSLGYLSNNATTTGGSNVAIGHQAFQNSTAGNYNVGIGVTALRSATGDYNVGIGVNALSVSTGSTNVGVGTGALQANTTGSGNVAMGNLAASSNTTGGSNSVIGYGTFINNTTGSNNSGVGESNLRSNTIGAYNNAFGSWAMYSNTTGNNNASLGAFSLNANSTGSVNVAIGNNSLYNANGTGNVGVGYATGTRLSSGTYNVLLGNEAGDYITTGSRNIIMGYQSGALITTGNNNTLIGVGANVTSGGGAFTNATALGYNAIVGASNSLVLGGTGTQAVRVGINTTTPQYKLDIDANTGSTGNPLRLQGLQAGATSDSIVSSNGGILRRLSIAQVVGGSAWSTTGNASTVDGTNFIGTTDNIPFNIRVNNFKAGRIDHLNFNAFYGFMAGNANTGTRNSFFGHQAGSTNTSGIDNVGLGYGALGVNTTASNNIAVGSGAMESNTTGYANVAIGRHSMRKNITSYNNTAVGTYSLQENLGGYYNTAVGWSALNQNTSGFNNTAVGAEALLANITGNSNAAYGIQSLYFNTSGHYNTSVGIYSMFANTSGNNNVALGALALGNNLTGWGSTAIGYKALTNTTVGGLVAVGDSALFANTTGAGNTAMGYQAGLTNQTGANNTFMGYQADATSVALTNAAAIGYNAKVAANNSLILGGTGANAVYVGMGTTTPLYKVHIEEPGGYNGDIAIRLYNTNNAGYLPSLILQTARGTKTLPTAVTLGTILGTVRYGGYDGSAFSDIYAGELRGNATENWSTTAHGTSLNFGTIANGTTTLSDRMIIDQNGRVGIGISIPNQQLEITQAFRFPATTTSTTGVIYKDANRFIHNYKPSANDGNNTFIGVNAGNFTMASATSWLSSGNTGIGVSALTALTDGGYNTALGVNAMTANTTGSYNMGIGSFALAANTIGVGNTALGHNTLAVATANNNTAIGNACLAATTTGYSNTGMGDSNLNKNTLGNQNTAIGQATMKDNLTGSNNTAVGLSALQANTGGGLNVAVGVSTLVNNLTGNNNTAVGYNSLSATTSSNNVALGYLAGVTNTTGTNNTYIGYNTGATNSTGSNNTLLGYQANVASAALTNATAIGNGASVSASNKVRIGNASVTVIEGQVAYSFPSDRRLKKDITDNTLGLAFIKDLRPVHYVLKTDSTHIVQDGFIAQDIEATMNKLGITFSGLNKPQNEKDYYSVAYSTFVVPLVNAVKELDTKVEALTKENDILKAKLNELEALKEEVEKIKKAIGMNISPKK